MWMLKPVHSTGMSENDDAHMKKQSSHATKNTCVDAIESLGAKALAPVSREQQFRSVMFCLKTASSNQKECAIKAQFLQKRIEQVEKLEIEPAIKEILR